MTVGTHPVRHRPLPWATLALALAVAAGAPLDGSANAGSFTWIGPSGGLWRDEENWSPKGIPAVFDDVFVTSASLVDYDMLTSGATNLTTGTGDEIFMSAGTLRIDGGTLTNAGLISLHSTGGLIQLRFDTADVTIDGGGTIAMSDHPGNLIQSASSEGINVDNTIMGGGSISGIGFVNQALVVANTPTPLTIGIGPQPFQNTGTVRADTGGTIMSNSTTFQNTGGVIEALGGGTISLNGSEILGGNVRVVDGGELSLIIDSRIADGVLANSNVGTIRIAAMFGAPNTLGGTLNNPPGGVVVIENGAILELESSGTYNNEGEIRLASEAAGVAALVSLDGDVSIGGGGSIRLVGTGADSISAPDGQRIINVDNTIEGDGEIGDNLGGFTNHGLIQANGPGVLSLHTDVEDGFVNTGTVQTTGGSTLLATSGAYDNTGGVFQATDGGVLDLDNDADVTGGTVRVVGASELRLNGGSATAGLVDNSPTGVIRAVTGESTLAGTVTNPAGGVVAVDNNARLRLLAGGTYENAGEIRLEAAGGVAWLIADGGDVLFTGGGTIRMSDHPANDIFNENGGRIVNVDNTIRGAGEIIDNTGGFLNQGTVIADGVNPLIIDPTTTAIFENTGALRAIGPGGVRIPIGSFTTSGTVEVALGSTLDRAGVYTQTAGVTTVEGELIAGGVDLDGGMLDGNGVVTSNVDNVAGVVAPGASAGILDVNGAYSQGADAALAIEIGGLVAGDEHDQLAISGPANLDGVLGVTLIDGFEPALGETFVVLVASEVNDAFAAVDLPELGGNLAFDLAYDETTVTLVTVPDLPADINDDGVVDFGDLLLVLAAWGPCPGCPEDINDDGVVNFEDLLFVLSTWS